MVAKCCFINLFHTLLWCRLINAKAHHILKAAHPSGLSAHRGFFGCRCVLLNFPLTMGVSNLNIINVHIPMPAIRTHSNLGIPAGRYWVLKNCNWLGVSRHFMIASLLVSTAYWSTFPSYDWGEPAVSYKWTGWVWEIFGWSSRLQENYWSF